MEKRWHFFKKNRRAYGALILFSVLFGLSLMAEFIANDKPLLVRYKDDFYVPFLKMYPEKIFGGDFDTETVYRDPHVQDLIEKEGWMLWPPIRFKYDTINDQLDVPAPSPPSWENLLGTDDQGRDVAARLIYGFRLSVLFGLILTLFSSVIGVMAGGAQGYFAGRFDL